MVRSSPLRKDRRENREFRDWTGCRAEPGRTAGMVSTGSREGKDIRVIPAPRVSSGSGANRARTASKERAATRAGTEFPVAPGVWAMTAFPDAMDGPDWMAREG